MLNSDEQPYSYLDFPGYEIATFIYDEVRAGGRTAGIASESVYFHPDRKIVAIAVVDPDIEIGDEVTLLWGDKSKGERQLEVRATVNQSPRAKIARESYAKGGWRAGQK